jgi:glutaminyl-tRNA synthetase
VVELRCTYDPDSRGGDPKDGRKIKGTLHWVSEQHSVPAEVRLYDRLFATDRPATTEGVDFLQELNPNSLVTLQDSRVERSLAGVAPGQRFQFERQGYFSVDPDTTPERPVFNRIVTLKDTWARIMQAPR